VALGAPRSGASSLHAGSSTGPVLAQLWAAEGGLAAPCSLAHPFGNVPWENTFLTAERGAPGRRVIPGWHSARCAVGKGLL